MRVSQCSRGRAGVRAVIEELERRRLLSVAVTSVVLNGNDSPALAGKQRSRVDSIVYGFSEPVNIAASGAFTVSVHSGETGTVPTLAWNAISPAGDGSSSQWAVSFSGLGVTGNSIANGVYDAAVNGSLITSDANPSITCDAHATDTFYRLFGDINGDETVNAADNLRFKNAIDGSYVPAFDSNGDGAINAIDNLKFKNDLSVGYAGDDFTQTISSPTVATQLAFGVHSLTTGEGVVINPGITVSVEDASGNLASGDTSSIALSISSGTLHGTLTEATVGGVATFSDLSISAAGSYVLTAADGALTNDTLSSLNIAPAAPMDLTALSSSPIEIDLNWTNNSTSATSITICRSTDGVDFPTIATLSPSATSFPDTGLSEGTHYFYQVIAKYGSLSSALMTVDTFAEPAAPSAPTITMTDGQAVLNWTNNSVDSPAFFIEQSKDGVNFNVMDETDPGVLTYKIPADGTTYYRVDALNGDGTAANPSGIASVVSAITPPSDLFATSVSANEVDLEWTNNSVDASGTAILRSTNGGSFSLLTPLADPTIDSYADTGLSAGTNYAYEVEAVQGSSSSDVTSAANDTTVPAAPSGFTVTVDSTTQLDLGWTASAGAAGYDIQRKVSDGDWIDVAQIADGSATSYTDSGLWDGLTYDYQVDAYNNAGTSDMSSGSATTETKIPTAPVVSAVALSSTSMEVVWSNRAYNETSFEIDRQVMGGSWTMVATAAPGDQSYIDTGLTAGTSYVYRVTAFNSANDATADPTGEIALEDSTGYSCTPTYADDYTYSLNTVNRVQDAAELGPDGYPIDGYFKISRGGDISAAGSLSYDVDTSASDAATPGYEYEALSGIADFDAGQRTALVQIEPDEIRNVEDAKTVKISVANEGGAPVVANVAIHNTDAAEFSRVDSKRATVGIDSEIIVSVVDAYGRPYKGTITVSGNDELILEAQSPAGAVAKDGTIAIPVHGVARGSTSLVLNTADGAEGSVGVDVRSQKISIPDVSRIPTTAHSGYFIARAVHLEDANGQAVGGVTLEVAPDEDGHSSSYTDLFGVVGPTNGLGDAAVYCRVTSPGDIGSLTLRISSPSDESAVTFIGPITVRPIAVVLTGPDSVSNNQTGRWTATVIDAVTGKPVEPGVIVAFACTLGGQQETTNILGEAYYVVKVVNNITSEMDLTATVDNISSETLHVRLNPIA